MKTKKNRADALESQVQTGRREISADGYPMSIGELTNLYRDGELTIRPEFQRFYRWTKEQRSRLIESILLGIPLPSIFVAQGKGGAWELVDGLQRISTILELQGVLKGDDGTLPQLTLVGTKYLPGLEGRQWEHPDDATRSFSSALRLDVKRTKIDVKILKRESSQETKFDLFQRLNSYGSSLTAQEIRSAMLVGTSPAFFRWLEELSQLPDFRDTVSLSERLLAERYDLELVLRFLVLHNRDASRLSQSALRDFSLVLDTESIALAIGFSTVRGKLDRVFRDTFKFIAENGGESVFQRYDIKRGEFRGSFLNTAFEIFALGVGFHLASRSAVRRDLLDVAKRLWRTSNFASGYATGRSTEARLAEFVPLGRKLLAAGPSRRTAGAAAKPAVAEATPRPKLRLKRPR